MASASELPKLYQGVQKQSFGYKMLSTMGWTEGQGLVSFRAPELSAFQQGMRWRGVLYTFSETNLNAVCCAVGCQQSRYQGAHQGQEEAGRFWCWGGELLSTQLPMGACRRCVMH